MNLEREKKRKETNKNHIKSMIVVIIMLSFIEGVLFILESNNDLSEPYLWGSRYEIPYKINRCRELFSAKENKGKIKVIMIGDSLVERGFNPMKFDEIFNEKTISYNFGISGTGLRFQSFLISKVLIKRINPDVIIWGFTLPGDFDGKPSSIEK